MRLPPRFLFVFLLVLLLPLNLVLSEKQQMVSPGIYYTASTSQFTLQGKESSYVFRIDRSGLLEHLHWGAAVHSLNDFDDLGYLASDSIAKSFDAGSKNAQMLEWADYGTGDFRAPSFRVRYGNGTSISPLVYVSHQIFPGKPIVDSAQPAIYLESDSEATSLRLLLEDPITKLQVHLWFTIYHDYDIITRRAVIMNNQSDGSTVYVEILNSATVDFPQLTAQDWHFSQLSGSWARERHFYSRPLKLGTTSVQSRRGASSHQHNPFALFSAGIPAHEELGEHFAFNLIYSGNFLIEAEVIQTGRLRVNVGINPFNFEWRLRNGETFTSPEVVMVYSASGYGKISRQLHRIYRTRLVRGFWRDQRRPILVNSWEAMYFDVSEEKILNNLAKPAADLGIELVVLDDGWFGERNNDRTSLGDWYVNLEKFPNGIAYLANEINSMGLTFGIWMEPEMISVDSNLYRAHPDWCLHTGDRARTESRNQLVLDLSRPEVRDFIVDAVVNILGSANIQYLKWDFNRHLTEVSSEAFGIDQQGEINHRFVLGVYDVMNRITSRFPNVLFESCSGGGGRFDPAMLYYMPQVWASDNTDGVARGKIQYGTSIAYPASALGAHVSVSPNEQNGRVTSMKTRSLMAMSGTFGYELDLLELSEADKIQVREFIAIHLSVEEIVRTGDMYRLLSPFDSNLCAWMFVTADQTRAAVFAFNSEYYEVIWNYPRLKLRGLSPDAIYSVKPIDLVVPQRLSGRTLMSAGLVFQFNGDSESALFILDQIA